VLGVVRYLIVNADDFGLCTGVNRGVMIGHTHGIVTSASLMVRQPAAVEAVSLAASMPRLSLGLHIDLGEWRPSQDGGWTERYHVVNTDRANAVEREVARQLLQFRELTGDTPTHLDGHQHVQRTEPAESIVRAMASNLGVPLRLHDSQVRYRGDFYGQDHRGDRYEEGVSVANLLRVLASLPDGWTELGCHPGVDVDADTSTYNAERAAELETLCAPEVLDAIADYGITLSSFGDLARAAGPAQGAR
jgi:chitin disaccharide deacetylase